MIGAFLALLAVTYDEGLAERLTQLTRASHWTAAGAISVGFDTYHPQGMVRISGAYFVSSVDKEGRAGHLFKIDASGKLLADLKLTEGDLYHPGGIDYDGQTIWLPVAEYRPDSRAIIYRVNPETMKATEILRFADHIGGIVHNTDDNTLHGVTWGSRRFYRWTLDNDGKVTNGGTPPERLRKPNQSHYIDYQDCKYVGRREMLCSGLNFYTPKKDGPRYALGG